MRDRATRSTILDVDDLIGYGVEGLIDAVDSFDPAYNVPIAAWAAMRVRGRIQDALRSLDPLSRADRARVRHITSTAAQLAAWLERWPDDTELAESASYPIEWVRAAHSARLRAAPPLDLDQPDAAGARHIADDDPWSDPEGSLTRCEEIQRLAAAIDGLPPRERLIIKWRYVNGKQPRLLAGMLGVSEARVSQIHARAIERLRGMLGQRPSQQQAQRGRRHAS